MACKFLEEKGLIVLKRNYRCRAGEIDIIAKENDTVVAIEVKGGYSKEFGTVFERVDKRKIKRVLNCFYKFLLDNGLDIENIRIDAIFIDKNNITYLKNVLENFI